jgi:hypothetical protein
MRLCEAWVLLGGWVAQAAWAADVAVVGAHDLGLDADGQHALTVAIAAAVDLTGAHKAVPQEQLAERFVGREDLILGAAFDAEGRRMLEDGRILYQQAQADDAAVALEAAVESLTQSVASTRSVRSLWEAWMLLGTALLATGDEPGARDAVAAAVALHAERRPDPASYPPPVLALYEEERDLLADELGTLMLRTDEPEVEFWIDGRSAGVASELSRELPPGTHYVHARSAAGRVAFVEVEVPADGAISLTPELSEPRLGPTRGSVGARSQQIASLYAALGTYAKVDLVLLVGRVDGVMHVQLHAPELGAFSQPEVLSRQGSTEEVVEGVRRLLRKVEPSGALSGASSTFVAVPLDVAANPVLAAMLLTPPPSERAPAPLLPVSTEIVPGTPAPTGDPDVRKKPRWPTYVGIGVGAAAVAAGVTALAVVFGGGGGEVEPNGTLVIGPPR